MPHRTSLPKFLLIVMINAAFATCVAAAELTPVNVEGVVVEVGREGLILRTEEGVDYTVSVNPKRMHMRVVYEGLPKPRVSVSGPGLPQHVVSGVFVDLEMDLTPRRESRHVIPALRILSRQEDTPLGCFGRRDGGGVRLEPTPFAQVGEGKYRVVGQLSLRGNEATIAVPGGVIRGRIANTPLVQLEVADHRFAVRGDHVTLAGFSPALPFVFATELTVKRREEAQAIPPKREAVVEADAVKPPLESKPIDEDAGQSLPQRKPLTILKVN